MSYVSVRGLGASVIDAIDQGPIPGSPAAPCPEGTHQVCMAQRPGQPLTASMCSCRPDTQTATQAAISSTAKYKWGLFAGLAIAAIVVVKIAT